MFHDTPWGRFTKNSSQCVWTFLDAKGALGRPLQSRDWVGGFCNDICVGARQWDTSECSGGVCDVVLNGTDSMLPLESVDYCQVGQVPQWKIYEDTLHTWGVKDTGRDAWPTTTFSFVINQFNIVESLSVRGHINPKGKLHLPR